MTAVVIADIMGSRRLAEREQAQQILDDVTARVEEDAPLATRPLRPTVGDEQQAVYPGLDEALASLLLLQLALPEGLEFRYGIGVGAIRDIAAAAGTLTDGPGWWAAREAIEVAERKQRRAAPYARTWAVAAPEEDVQMHALVRSANAQLTLRDDIVARMSDRQRRLAYGRCLGVTQRELAAQEGIGQPAVSQALASSGGTALADAYALLLEGKGA